MKIYDSVEELIGGTPIVRLHEIEKAFSLKAALYAKVEFFNPAGSVKDRAALYMINDAEKRGLLSKGSTLIEPTSGNTGIGLCAIAARRGYRAVIVMPDSMSRERIMLMKAYGAEVVLTPGAQGMAGSIEKAYEIAKNTKQSFVPDQFNNPANALAHYETTAPEIYEALGGKVDVFVAGVGTGGTVSGCARYFKERSQKIKIVGAEPQGSPFITEGIKGAHKIQGIGAGFIPSILDTALLDEVVAVSDEDALKTGALLPKKEGLLVGISSGCALYAAIKQAQKSENAGKNVVALLPDTGERYLSSEMFE